MHAFLQFLMSLWHMPLKKKLWAVALATTNLGIPLFYVQHLEAQIVLGVYFVNVVALSALTALTGYTRLVSLGHMLWVPLIYFFWLQLEAIPSSTLFGLWIRWVMLLNAVTLLLDARDIYKYVRGDRKLLVEDS